MQAQASWIQCVSDNLYACPHCQHPVSEFRTSVHEKLCSCSYEVYHIRCRKHTCNMKRGILSKTVANDDRWSYTPRLPKAGQSNLHASQA